MSESRPPSPPPPHKLAEKAALLASLPTERDLWLFAYGSLMWNPEFAFQKRVPARVHGYHRGFCVYSHTYRGTPEKPGLVLGLDRGGSCMGFAYRIAACDRVAVIDALWKREMDTGVYDARFLKLREGGRLHDALAFTVDRQHSHYAGGLDAERTAKLVRQGVGARGRCLDYLASLVEHLDALGIKDGEMHRLLKRARGSS
ncbi:MAG: gamma-glutamylcyclotransferase [Alphaproteobacteria bacterium]|nr:gamma-glutamylcyclotransferase [Alphaproteobacteria bacterium]